MEREQFIEEVEDMIANAVMRAQGIGDWMPQPEPRQIAESIADLATTLRT